MLKVIAKVIMINVQIHVLNMDIALMESVNVQLDGLALIVIHKLDVLIIAQIKEHVMLMDHVLVKQDIVEMIVK